MDRIKHKYIDFKSKVLAQSIFDNFNDGFECLINQHILILLDKLTKKTKSFDIESIKVFVKNNTTRVKLFNEVYDYHRTKYELFGDFDDMSFGEQTGLMLDNTELKRYFNKEETFNIMCYLEIFMNLLLKNLSYMIIDLTLHKFNFKLDYGIVFNDEQIKKERYYNFEPKKCIKYYQKNNKIVKFINTLSTRFLMKITRGNYDLVGVYSSVKKHYGRTFLNQVKQRKDEKMILKTKLVKEFLLEEKNFILLDYKKNAKFITKILEHYILSVLTELRLNYKLKGIENIIL